MWRETGCGSHFIWRDQISLLSQYEEETDFAAVPPDETVELMGAIREQLPDEGLVSFWDLAEKVHAVPWELLTPCRDLVRSGFAHDGKGKGRGSFGRNKMPGLLPELALIEGNQQVATKHDESISLSLFSFRSHFASIHRKR